MDFYKIGPEGAGRLYEMVAKLAAYLGKESELTATEADIRALLEGPMEAVLLKEDGRDVGMATYFYMVSTFSGQKILYIEDLYVEESVRGKGYGRGFFDCLERLAADSGCAGLEWKCFLRNTRAQAFYSRLGAQRVDDWLTYRKAL